MASSVFRRLPDLVRSLTGKRTAIDDRILRPVFRTSLPRRETASDSTVAAGEISVSITTGETLDSITRISGRSALFFNIPVFSDLTALDLDQIRRVFRKTAARASLIVCSVVAIEDL